MRKNCKFLICVSLACVTLFSSCGETGTKKNRPVELFYELDGAKLECYESKQLVLAEGVDEVEWKSSDPQIVVVENGKLIAVSEGSATITAQKGDNAQTQQIVVSKATSTPTIDVNSLSVLYGDSYEFDAQTYYKNVALDGVTYSCSSANDTVCSITENTVLSGVSYGETTVTVSAVWRGKTIASKDVVCKVNRNAAVYADKDEFLLYTRDKVLDASFATAAEITEKVYFENRIVDDAEVVWGTLDESVAIVQDNMLQAVSDGSTFVVGKCVVEGVELTSKQIPVTVEKPYLSTSLSVLFEAGEELGFLDAETLLDETETIDRAVEITSGNSYVISEGNLPLGDMASGEYRFALYAKEDAFATEVTVRIADYIVRTAEDLKNLSQTENLNLYAVLANDLIDVGSYKPANKSGAYNFTGTLDGAGHIISGIALAEINAGIFGWFSGTVKNLAVIGRTAAYGNQGAFYYMANGNPVFDNVYVEITLSNGYGFSGNGALGGGINADSITIRNSVIIADTSNGKSIDSTFGIVSGRVITYNFNIQNSYFIGRGTLFGTEASDNNRTFSALNQKTQTWYATREDFLEAKNAGLINFAGYNASWDLSDIPSFKGQ